MSVDAEQVKQAARGRWAEILSSLAGVDAAILNGQHHPCPKCGGKDRFRFIDAETGAFICSQCRDKDSGDGLAFTEWMTGCLFPEAVESVGSYLGITNGAAVNGSNGKPASMSMTESYAKLKNIPLESFRAFGAIDAKRGKLPVCRVPMFGADRKICSHFDMADNGEKWLKGFAAKSKPAGLFAVCNSKIDKGKPVCLVEGVKDAAALHSLGYQVLGLPTCKLNQQFVRMFDGLDVILIPDRDRASIDGFNESAKRLYAKAASISIAHLPGEVVESHGDGVREVRAGQGDEAVHAAIREAREVTPEEIEVALKAAKDAKKSKLKANGDILDITSIEGRTTRANGLRFANRYRDETRYVPAWEKFLVWTGTRWEIDTGDVQTVKRAMEFTDELFSTARQSGEFESIMFVAKTANSGIGKMIDLAKPYLAVDHQQFDSDPFLLNCPNGTIDLRTGELRPHNRDDNITKLCPTKFHPAAESFVWDRFLESLFDQQDEIDYLRRFYGYCLTGDVREQCLNIFWGGGANGKSTQIEAILTTLGPDYAMSAPAEMLMDTRNDRHPTEKADLFGKRFVVCNETEANRTLKESLVKQLTGGDTIRARRMKEDFWEFQPTHKLVLLTNHKPTVKGQDHAIWRRLRLVPFVKQFWDAAKGESGPPELEADKTLSERLKRMSEAVLAWAVQGCLEWQRDGLGASRSMQEATAAYRTESDVIGRFVAECCLQNEHMKIRASSLNEALERFCDETGDYKPNAKHVSQWMEKAGIRKKQNNGIWYLGISLRYESDQPEGSRTEGTEGTEPSFGLF